MSLVADELRDLEMSNEDRQVYVGPEGDLALTSGIGTVMQSLALTSGDVLRPLVGSRATDDVIADVEAELERRLRQDPQLAEVTRVVVEKVNTTTNTVTVTIVVKNNNEFTTDVNV